jgi:hypothetical protein
MMESGWIKSGWREANKRAGDMQTLPPKPNIKLTTVIIKINDLLPGALKRELQVCIKN